MSDGRPVVPLHRVPRSRQTVEGRPPRRISRAGRSQATREPFLLVGERVGINAPRGSFVAALAVRSWSALSRSVLVPRVRSLARNSADGLDARVRNVSAKRVVGGLIAVAMLLGGGFLALAGMGYIVESGGTSRSWSIIGSLLAGLGVALAITIFTRRR